MAIAVPANRARVLIEELASGCEVRLEFVALGSEVVLGISELPLVILNREAIYPPTPLVICDELVESSDEVDPVDCVNMPGTWTIGVVATMNVVELSLGRGVL